MIYSLKNITNYEYIIFSVPPNEPVVRNQKGEELFSREIGPYEVGQNLILDCEVSGGEQF